MKALVTGAAGFIGSHLSGALLDRGAEVSGSTASPTTIRVRSRKRMSTTTAGARGFPAGREPDPGCGSAVAARGRDPRLSPRGTGRRAKELGAGLQHVYREQRGGFAAAAGGVRRAAAAPLRVCVELVALWRQRRNTDARRRAAAAGVAVRSDEAGGRAAVLPLSRQLRRPDHVVAVLHRVWPASAARHGVPPVHPRRARSSSRSRSTATANRRATSRSCSMRSREQSRPETAACQAAPTTWAAAHVSPSTRCSTSSAG